MEFCKAFNAATANMEKGMPVPVVITAYRDRTFTFVTKTTPVAYFLKKASGVAKGTATPSRNTVGKVTMAQVKELAEATMVDLDEDAVEAAVGMVKRSRRSRGLQGGGCGRG